MICWDPFSYACMTVIDVAILLAGDIALGGGVFLNWVFLVWAWTIVGILWGLFWKNMSIYNYEMVLKQWLFGI